MSEADKMFEMLGYKKHVGYDGNAIRYTKRRSNHEKWILFNTPAKLVSFLNSYDDVMMSNHVDVFISLDELKAINKKCEELGWLDKE